MTGDKSDYGMDFRGYGLMSAYVFSFCNSISDNKVQLISTLLRAYMHIFIHE